ncbi:hypothetical protein CRG98_012177 [Punica granatum]|uniref:Uncharacterized protein n=1 Tax=Punica granatum TaxID=22663 RepID=A0A2I0KG06_PUNGR|nr:hypothetical protein CRG98_012177 [Punica granatum]
MHEGKSRGSGLESRKTRLVATGDGYPRAAVATTWRKRGRHASSDHGMAKDFGDFWLKSGRVVIGIPGGFPSVLASFGLGMGCARMRERAGD